jgi:hypothetical protein
MLVKFLAGAAEESEIKESIFDNEKELYGAGIRSYGKLFGFLLSIIGFASELKVGEKKFYVNNNSFSQFVIRSVELNSPSSMKDAAKKLDAIYAERKKIGYDKKDVALVKQNFVNIIKYNNVNDIARILKELQEVVRWHGKKPH